MVNDSSSKGPRTIGNWLSQAPRTTRDLLRQAQVLADVAARLNEVLPAEVRPHWQLARLGPQLMVVTADGSAWAMRLRHLSPQLRTEAERITGMRPRALKVKVANLPRATREVQPRQLSAKGAEALLRAAESVADPELKAALLRLARRR